MKNSQDSFLKGRLRSFRYAFRGVWILVRTEHSIIVQLGVALLMTFAGFWLNISSIEWIAQILAIGMVLVTESLNTAIEKMCDFVHPEFSDRIGRIKDIAAGGVIFAAITAIAIGLVIYLPKFLELV